MARKGVTKADVVISANTLIAKGIVPTAAGIREDLGRGSLSTIQKYFKDWKLESFKDRSVAKERSQVNARVLVQNDKIDGQSLERRIIALEQQCKILSQDLIKREQENLKLNQENEKLAQNLAQLTGAYKDLSLRHEGISAGYEALKNERETALQIVIADKNKQVENLKCEIKQMNAVHLNAITESGRKSDELLIQEKVKTINLTEKVKELQQHIKMIEEKLGKAEGINTPLQKEVKQQKTMVDKFVTWEQLKQFIRREVETQEDG
jgi:hypothetical protein